MTRAASGSPKKLAASQSAAHASVTLYKLEDLPADMSPTLELPLSPLTDVEDELPLLPDPPPRKSARVCVKAAAEVQEQVTAEMVPTPTRTPRGRVSKRKAEDAPFTPAPPKKAKSGSASARNASRSPTKTLSRQRSEPSRKAIRPKLEVPHPEPENWREVYDIIKEMRSKFVAPVDTMGCHLAQRHETDPKNKRLITLVSLMLSSQTKDEVVDDAIIRLRKAIGGTLSLDALLAADNATIASSINKCGFWKKKTDYLKGMALMLRDEFNSDVPKTIEELCAIRGVGEKMGFLCLHAAWGINNGIGVDVHVDRITNRLGWHKPSTIGQPDKTRRNLESWLPPHLHSHINTMLVGFGQVICKPQRPSCDECTLSTTGLCPSAQVVAKDSRKAAAKVRTGAKIDIELEEDAPPMLSS